MFSANQIAEIVACILLSFERVYISNWSDEMIINSWERDRAGGDVE